jgi:hypothetical protein
MTAEPLDAKDPAERVFMAEIHAKSRPEYTFGGY